MGGMVQFHATDEEMFEFVQSVLETHPLQCVLLSYKGIFKPCLAKSIDRLKEVWNQTPMPRNVFFFMDEPDLQSPTSWNNFPTYNRNHLLLMIGELKNDYLYESSLGFITQDEQIKKVWQSIMRKIKKLFLKGAWVKNIDTGDMAYYKTCYYTKGVLELQKRGTKMLPLGGGLVYHFGEEQPSSFPSHPLDSLTLKAGGPAQ